MRHPRSLAVPAVVLIVAILALLTLSSARRADASSSSTSSTCIAPIGASDSASAATHRASVVVTYADRHTQTYCVEFVEDSITGLQLLQRTGLPLVMTGSGGLGSAICSIDGEGSNDPTNCFASCSGGGTCAYWAYFRFLDGAWKFSQVGASQRVIHDGDIDGWGWGSGSVANGAAPEPPGEICPVAPVETATSTPTETATPKPTSIATGIPSSATAAPATQPPASPTARPTAAPSPASTTAPDAIASPADALPPPDTVIGGLDPPPPDTQPPAGDVTPISGVEGIALTPARTPSAGATPSPSARSSATPRTGAVVIDAQQGADNEARAATPETNSGGNSASLIAFGIVVLALTGIAGVVAYRRRRVA